MFPRIPSLLSLVAMPVPVQPAAAQAVLTAPELASQGKVLSNVSDSAEAQYSIRYIQGVIDGAVAIDARVMINLESRHANETFSELFVSLRSPNRKIYGRADRYADFNTRPPFESDGRYLKAVCFPLPRSGSKERSYRAAPCVSCQFRQA